MRDERLPSYNRVSAALAAGAFTGAGLTGLSVTVGGTLHATSLNDASMMILLGLIVSAYALVVWGFGMVCIGLPVWALLCRAGITNRIAAVSTGTGLCLAAAQLLSGPHATAGAAAFAALLGSAGGVAGWVVWRVAYGPASPAGDGTRP